MNAIAVAHAALDRAYGATWPDPDWEIIIPALNEAAQHLRAAGLLAEPPVMQFMHLTGRAAGQGRGNDTRAYIGNIRSYLPAPATTGGSP